MGITSRGVSSTSQSLQAGLQVPLGAPAPPPFPGDNTPRPDTPSTQYPPPGVKIGPDSPFQSSVWGSNVSKAWGTPLCALCSRHPKNITLMEKKGRTGEETTLVSGTRSQGPARPGYAGGGIWKGDKGEETGRRAQIFRNQHGGLWGPLKDLFSAVAALHLPLEYLCASP